MLSDSDSWFMHQEEPAKSCLFFLRTHILKLNKTIVEEWSYGMPFYKHDKKRFCYLWVHKKYKQPYIGFVDGNKLEHPDLLQEKRSRMKIFLIDPKKNIPVKNIDKLLKEAITLSEIT